MIALADTIDGKPVLIPSADQFVSAIAAHEGILSEHYIISPAAALQGALADKQTQYDLAARHGMPMPVTQLITSEEEIEAFAREAEFPCVLKPLHFREWQKLPPGNPLSFEKVAVAENSEELLTSWQLAKEASPKMIAQEVIIGSDAAKRVYLSCYDSAGNRIGHAMFRELRCTPLGFGPATVTEPVLDEEADSECNRFLQSIGYRGICEIEVKRDTRDGRVKLIEANPRLSGSGDAAPHAGVDLCWLHYLDLIGQPVEPVGPKTRDFRHVVLRSDASAIGTYRRAGLISWREIFRSYKYPLAFFDLDRRDWRYSLETLLISGRQLFREFMTGLARPGQKGRP